MTLPVVEPAPLQPVRPAALPLRRGGSQPLVAVYARALRPVAPQSAFTRCRREADTQGWTVSTLLYDTERSLRYWRHLMERLRSGRCEGVVADMLDARFFDDAEIQAAADLVERTGTFLVVLDGGLGGRSAFGSPPAAQV